MVPPANPLATEALLPREQLDIDYNARSTVGHKFDDEMRAYRRSSDGLRERWLTHADVVYDTASGQSLDIYGTDPEGSLRPVFVFIHGGYWRALSKRDSSMMVGTLANAGIATAVVDYELAPGASLREIVRQVRAAISYLWHEGAALGIDPKQIHVGGSSAGAHLAGAILAKDWHHNFGVPDDAIRSALLLSGLYELAPIAACFPQDWLGLTERDVEEFSPIRNIPKAQIPILVAWAELEADGFKRQSRAFAQAWSGVGNDLKETIEVPNSNHFNVLLELEDDRSELSRRLIHLIQG
jgi:arylformamidase